MVNKSSNVRTCPVRPCTASATKELRKHQDALRRAPEVSNGKCRHGRTDGALPELTFAHRVVHMFAQRRHHKIDDPTFSGDDFRFHGHARQQHGGSILNQEIARL